MKLKRLSFRLLVSGLLLLWTIGLLNALSFRPVMGLVSYGVSTLLGRRVDIQAIHIGFSFREGLNVDIHQLRIVNPDWVNAKQPGKLVSLGHAHAGVSIAGLLHGRLDIDNISVDQLSLSLIDKGPDRRNYVFAALEGSPAEAASQQNGPPFDFAAFWQQFQFPSVSLHDIQVSYDDGKQSWHMAVPYLALYPSSGDSSIVISGIGSINHAPLGLRASLNNPHQLFTRAGSQLKGELNAGMNKLSTRVQISLHPAFRVEGRARMTTTRLAQVFTMLAMPMPGWLQRFDSAGVLLNARYKNHQLEHASISAHTGYQHAPFAFQALAHSRDRGSLFPMRFSGALTSGSTHHLALSGTVDTPFIEDQWLDATVDARFADLAYLTARPTPDKLNRIHLQSQITMHHNSVSVAPLAVSARLDNKEIEGRFKADVSFAPAPGQADLEGHVHYEGEEIARVTAHSALATDQPDWLEVVAYGNVGRLEPLLESGGISTPYDLEHLEYRITAMGAEPDRVLVTFDPVTIDVNQQPLYVSGGLEANLQKPELAWYMQANVDTRGTNRININGKLAPSRQKKPWLKTTLDITMAEAENLAFLFRQPPGLLKDIHNIRMPVQVSVDERNIRVSSKRASVDFAQVDVNSRARLVYGWQQPGRPLLIDVSTETSGQDYLRIQGSGPLAEQKPFNLNGRGRLASLQAYSGVLPPLERIRLETRMKVLNEVLSLNTLDIKAHSNGEAMHLNASAEADIRARHLKSASLKAEVAGLKGHLAAHGRYHPATLEADLAVQAADLSQVNQMIHNWNIGYVPAIRDLELEARVRTPARQHYQGSLHFSTADSQLDVTGRARHQGPVWDLRALVKSPVINIKAFHDAFEKAGTAYRKQTADQWVRVVEDQQQDQEKIREKARKALKEQATVPQWMRVPIRDWLNYIDINADVDIRRIIFETGTAHDIQVAVNNRTNRQKAQLKASARNLFGSRLNINTRIDGNAGGDYHLQSSVYMGAVDLHRMMRDLYMPNPVKKGAMMIDMYGEGHGDTVNKLVNSFNGKLKFGVNDLKQTLANPQGQLGKFLLLLAGGDWHTGIEVNCAIGDFDIINGIYKINLLTIDTTGAVVEGSGEVDLPQQKVDIVLDPKAKYVNLSSLATAFRIAGNFRSLYFYPDVMSVAKTAGMVAGTTMLAATGIGMVAVGAAAATQMGKGLYYAHGDFCSQAMTPLSKKKLREIHQENAGFVENVYDQSTGWMSKGYQSVKEKGGTYMHNSYDKVGSGLDKMFDWRSKR